MSDKTKNDEIPEYPPLSVAGSDNAPFIFFDTSSAWGCNDGVILVSVEAVRMVSGAPDSRPLIDRVIVAHLRTTVTGAIALQDALSKALLLGLTNVSPAKN